MSATGQFYRRLPHVSFRAAKDCRTFMDKQEFHFEKVNRHSGNRCRMTATFFPFSKQET